MSANLDIIDNMKKLGLSEYEVKAYLNLLEHYPVNGYTLSKNSGIPRSRIYEVLDNLKNKQLVFEQIEGKNTLYHPLEPKLLMNKLKNNFEDILNNVDKYTKKIYSEEKSNSKVLVIKGRNEIINFLKLLILEAKNRVSVSIWEEELNDISKCIDDVLHRGVALKGIFFGRKNCYKELVSHRRTERYLSEKNERYIIIIVDSSHVVSGIVSRGEESQVTWTQDPGFIEMSEDYIAHDLMVNLYSQKLCASKREEYESFLDNVRKDYFNFTEEEFSNFK